MLETAGRSERVESAEESMRGTRASRMGSEGLPRRNGAGKNDDAHLPSPMKASSASTSASPSLLCRYARHDMVAPEQQQQRGGGSVSSAEGDHPTPFGRGCRAKQTANPPTPQQQPRGVLSAVPPFIPLLPDQGSRGAGSPRKNDRERQELVRQRDEC